MADTTVLRRAQPVTAGIGAASDTRQAPLTIALFVILLAAAAVPLFSVRIPALIDYPNHLGRIYTITHLSDNPILARFYSVHWKVIPNLGVDLLLPQLVAHMDVYLAGKLFVFLCMVLILTGVHALHYAVYRRLSLGPLVAFLFIYNFIFFYGFLNYLLGVGLALWGIAAWIGLRDSHPVLRGGVSLVFVLMLFACHLFTLGVYGLTLLSYEFWLLRNAAEIDRRKLRRDLLTFALPFLVVPALMLASPTAGLSLDIKWRPEAKFFGLFYIIKNFNNPLDAALGLLFAGAAVLAWRRRILAIHQVGWYLLAAALPVYLIMPDVLFGSWAADRRLPIAILFIVIGLMRWNLGSGAARALFLASVAGIALLRFAVVDLYWQWFDHLFAQVEESFRFIAPGSRILVGQLEEPPMRYTFRHFLFHAPCLAMIERSSFVPSAFTHPGKQVLQVNPAFQQISDVKEVPLPVRQVLIDEARHPEPNPRYGMYWSHWPERFDYLYIMYARQERNPLPGTLTPLYQGDEFSLYRIEKGSKNQTAAGASGG